MYSLRSTTHKDVKKFCVVNEKLKKSSGFYPELTYLYRILNSRNQNDTDYSKWNTVLLRADSIDNLKSLILETYPEEFI